MDTTGFTERIEKPMATKGTFRAERSLQILLVEDHADSADAMIALMNYADHRVTWVSSGEAAIEAFRRPAPGASPDVMILDLMLPDMSGVGLIRALREHWPVPPIVVLSAKPVAALEKEAQSLGAAAFLRKPFSIDGLLQAVARAAGPLS
jgi:DNA-binding response OmpR family regulator